MDPRRLTMILLAATLAVCLGCKKGSNGGAAKPLYDRLTEARKIADPLERADALIAIGEEYAKVEDALGARNSLRDAVDAADAVSLDNQATDRAKIHVRLATAWQAAGDSEASTEAYEKAEDALQKIDNPAEKCLVLIDLALLKIKLEENSAAVSDLKSAEETAAQVGDVYERVDMLAWVTYVYVQLKDTAEAKRVMDSARALAEGHESPSEKARILAVVGREQVNSLEDRETGLATLNQALELARAIEGNPNLKANVMIGVAENYMNVADPDKAREILNEAEELVRGLSEGKPAIQKIEQLRKQL